jgi:hypothetical protein
LPFSITALIAAIVLAESDPGTAGVGAPEAPELPEEPGTTGVGLEDEIWMGRPVSDVTSQADKVMSAVTASTATMPGFAGRAIVLLFMNGNRLLRLRSIVVFPTSWCFSLIMLSTMS